MSTERPYGDSYLTELLRLNQEQAEVANSFAAQTLYLREERAGRRAPGARPEVRERLAEEAAQEWFRLGQAILDLNKAEELKRAEYAKKEGAGC